MNKDRISVFILNHGTFGKSIVESAEMIIGKVEDVYIHSLISSMSLDDFLNEVEGEFIKIDGVKIILTDMFGGTPNNVAMYLKQKYGCVVITGFNLPMILELLLARDNETLEFRKLIDNSVKTGVDSIKEIEI